MLQKILDLFHNPVELFWFVFGCSAQVVFAGRFVWQWFVSEKKGRSTVPLGFWLLSLLGGVMLLIYACEQRQPVFAAGQLLSVIIYIRNLMLISRRRKTIQQRHPQLATGKRSAFPVEQEAQNSAA